MKRFRPTAYEWETPLPQRKETHDEVSGSARADVRWCLWRLSKTARSPDAKVEPPYRVRWNNAMHESLTRLLPNHTRVSSRLDTTFPSDYLTVPICFSLGRAYSQVRIS